MNTRPNEFTSILSNAAEHSTDTDSEPSDQHSDISHRSLLYCSTSHTVHLYRRTESNRIESHTPAKQIRLSKQWPCERPLLRGVRCECAHFRIFIKLCEQSALYTAPVQFTQFNVYRTDIHTCTCSDESHYGNSVIVHMTSPRHMFLMDHKKRIKRRDVDTVSVLSGNGADRAAAGGTSAQTGLFSSPH